MMMMMMMMKKKKLKKKKILRLKKVKKVIIIRNNMLLMICIVQMKYFNYIDQSFLTSFKTKRSGKSVSFGIPEIEPALKISDVAKDIDELTEYLEKAFPSMKQSERKLTKVTETSIQNEEIIYRGIPPYDNPYFIPKFEPQFNYSGGLYPKQDFGAQHTNSNTFQPKYQNYPFPAQQNYSLAPPQVTYEDKGIQLTNSSLEIHKPSEEAIRAVLEYKLRTQEKQQVISKPFEEDYSQNDNRLPTKANNKSRNVEIQNSVQKPSNPEDAQKFNLANNMNQALNSRPKDHNQIIENYYTSLYKNRDPSPKRIQDLYKNKSKNCIISYI